MNRVLLVGDAVTPLELDLVLQGFSCVRVPNAAGAVEALRTGVATQQPLGGVVVSATLPELSGAAFVAGIVRQFNVGVALLSDGDANSPVAELRSPKVCILPVSSGGESIADHFKKTAAAAPTTLPPTPATTLPPTPATTLPPPPAMTSPPPPATTLPPPPAMTSPPPPAAPPATAAARPAPPATPPAGTPAAAMPPRPAHAPTPSPPRTATQSGVGAGAPATRPRSPTQATVGAGATVPPRAAAAPPGQPAPAAPSPPPPSPSPPPPAGLSTSPPPAAPPPPRAASANAAPAGVSRTATPKGPGLAPPAAMIGSPGPRAPSAGTQPFFAVNPAATVTSPPTAPAPPSSTPASSSTTTTTPALAVERERDDLRAELELVRQTARAESADHQRTVAELTTTREKLAALELELEPLRAASARLDQAVTELAMLRAAEDDQDDVAELMAQLATHEAAAKSARAEVESLQARIKKADEVHAVSMAWRESELQREYEEALAQVRLEAEAHKLAPQASGDVDRLKARVAELEAVIAGRASDMEKLKAAKQSADAFAVAEQDRAQALETKLAQAEAQTAAVRAELQQQGTGPGAAEVAQWQRQLEASARELEELRPKVAQLEQVRAALADAQQKLAAAPHGDATNDAVRAQTRTLLELTRAVEPFLWGLEQATTFFGEANVDGGQRHIHSLRLLHKTLQKLKAEIERVQ